MDEKTKRVVEHMQGSLLALAETQATAAIGETVLALIGRGVEITPDSLIQALRQQADQQNSALTRAQNEAAEKAIQAACPTAPL